MTSLEALWAHHHGELRDPRMIVSQWEAAAMVDPELLRMQARGRWWEALERTKSTLIVTREYEHLVMALSVRKGRPHVTYLRLPHPSGLAVDHRAGRLVVASTRCPNQIFEFKPARDGRERPLLAASSRFYPGSLYLHDLAFIGGELYGNGVGQNAVLRLGSDGAFERAWWPRCIDSKRGPLFDRNYLQLNSIAAGRTVRESFFSASSDAVSARRPGHRNFPVDGRGVIFSGASREPVVRGLTRPHSARLHGGRLWVDNSGYGQLCAVDGGKLSVVVKLPGWTRGLCFTGGLAFVGTSRVIPRFESYAPGLDPAKTVCGLHAVDPASGRVLGSLTWPRGNQIFGIEWLPSHATSGFPFPVTRKASPAELVELFYSYKQ